LDELLTSASVLVHPFVIGEIALGNLRQHELVLDRLQDLPFAVVTDDAEVLSFIDRYVLSGFGISYIDAHLLAAVRLTAAARLWTRNKRLSDAARHLMLAAEF
jgi:predicted nucleic acid-binding protein